MTTSEVTESPRLWYERGSNLSMLAQVTYYAEGLGREPAFHPWAECGIGLAHYRLGEHKEAITHLERAIELAPTFARAWNNLGLAREALKDWAGAVAALEEAAQLDPGQPVIIDNLRQARKRLARLHQRAQSRARAGEMKPLHRRLMVAALAGAVFAVAYNYLSSYMARVGSLSAFYEDFMWFSYVTWFAQGGCLVAGIVGLWLAKGRPRPWVFAAAMTAAVFPYVNLFLLYGGMNYCAFEMLGLLASGAYFALAGMTWHGRRLPKVLLVVQCVFLVLAGVINYVFGCIAPGGGYWGITDSGYWDSPLRAAVRVMYVIYYLLAPATLELKVGFWVTTIQQPPRATR